VRLFLDAHISARRVATPLRDQGHDVRAADEDRELDRFTDEELLSLAAAEERIFVTFDVHDFPMIARRWAEAGRPHAGCAVMVGIDHGEFGAILETIAAALAARPDEADWTDLTLFLARTPPK
jgi:predicted nuclease of predicted toxin-antitoxin system